MQWGEMDNGVLSVGGGGCLQHPQSAAREQAARGDPRIAEGWGRSELGPGTWRPPGYGEDSGRGPVPGWQGSPGSPRRAQPLRA